MPPPLRLPWLCLVLTTSAAYAVDFRADPLLEPPVVNTHPGPEYQDEARVAGMIIGMDLTPKGRIWGSWTGTGDNSESYFILARSDDGGTTWSKPQVVIDPAEIPGLPPRFSLIGNFWCDPKGRMWLFFDQHMNGFAQTGWYIRCDNPDASEPKWSQPTMISDGSTLNKPIVLKSGEWLLPVSLLVPGRTKPGSTPAEDLAHQPMVHVYGSTDEGKTWARRGGVIGIAAADINHNEPMFVQLRDGRLWMLIRTRYGIAESYSSDDGRTWTEAKPSTIQNPATRFYLRRLASGRLLLVKNGEVLKRYPSRTHMWAFVSDDDGKTWGNGLLLDERGLVTYPDGFEDPSGLIRILYDRNRHGEGEILMATFREADVLAGKLVSSEAKLRQLINEPKAPGFSSSVVADKKWDTQAAADAKLDVMTVPYDGTAATGPAADANLRALRDGSWLLFLTTGDKNKPKSSGMAATLRTADMGKTWTELKPFAPELPIAHESGLGPIDVASVGDRSLLFFSAHAENWPDTWRTWIASSDRTAETWSKPTALSGPLATRTFVRNPITTRDGRLLAPFEHYDAKDTRLEHPRCGVVESKDGGKTWNAHGNIRLAPTTHRFDWEESNLVELDGGRIVMIIRTSAEMGTTYRAEATDGGKTWPEVATVLRAPSLGTESFFSLGGNAVAMIHNPAAKLSLWISWDGMKTWPYQRVLTRTATIGPKDGLRFPHGFVSDDKGWLHFAFVDNKQRAVHYSAKLPPAQN